MRESFSENLSNHILAAKSLFPVRVAGITPLTTIDFPEHLSSVLFLQGCPWRCTYCHNSHLWSMNSNDLLDSDEIYQFLKRRRGLLEAVVFSGGEPTAQPGLEQAIESVRNLGFKVGLHTSGAYPQRLAQLLPLLHWVGMDYKITLSSYQKITQIRHSGESALESANLLIHGNIPYEFRTTVDPQFHSEEILLNAAKELSDLGAKTFVLQQLQQHRGGYTGSSVYSQEMKSFQFEEWLPSDLLSKIKRMFPNFSVRTLS